MTNNQIRQIVFMLILVATQFACQQVNRSTEKSEPTAYRTADAPVPPESTSAKPRNIESADAATILGRKQVPILCYHQIRDWKPTDSRQSRDYIIPPDRFREQLQLLADSGYTSITPDQLNNYLLFGEQLPEKPVMLTFDDNCLDHYTVAMPELKKHGFKGVFFTMTVTIGKPRYMSKEQIRELSDAGHAIGLHTYDHKNVRKYELEDWVTQIEKPTKKLSEITGKPVEYFAYPFGLWRPEAIPFLKERGFKSAFQLADKMDPRDPQYSIRRIIVPGQWSTQTMYASMIASFRQGN